MKKTTPPRRDTARPQADTSRIPCSRMDGADPVEAPRPGACSSLAPTREGGSPISASAPNPASPSPTVPLPRKLGSAALMGLFGHKFSCAELSRAGLVASCDCKPGLMQDPAIAIGVVMHYARLGMAHRAPLPALIAELLKHHVEAGDPACIMVAEWLGRLGILTLPLPFVLRGRTRS